MEKDTSTFEAQKEGPCSWDIMGGSECGICSEFPEIHRVRLMSGGIGLRGRNNGPRSQRTWIQVTPLPLSVLSHLQNKIAHICL